MIAGTVVCARGGADLPAEPAIVRAAYLGDEPGVAAAIAAKADVNAANAAGATALLYGASHIAIVRELLEHGANPNLAAKSGMTPLMAAAAQSDSYATVKLLLDHGADIHAKIGKWEAVLPHAVFGGDFRTIKLLLDRGASPGITAPLTTSPLVEAAYMGDLSTVKLLLDRGANPNDNGDFAGHALNWALYSEQPDCAAELIRRGSDLKFRSPWGAGTPPVVFAAYNQTGDPAIEQMLVARGAAVNAANESGADAMTLALRSRPESPLVAYLRSCGLKPGATPGGLRLAPPVSAAAADLTDAALRVRVQHAIAALQLSSDAFLQRGFVQHDAKCVSCHQQYFPAMAARLAAEHGVPVDLESLGRNYVAMRASWTDWTEAARQLEFDTIPDPPLVLGYGGLSLAAWRNPSDAMTEPMVRFLLATQRSDGSWASHDIRPPIEDGPIVGTAIAARFVSLFAGPQQQADVARSLALARRFLEAARPDTLNRRVFRLFGLSFTGGLGAERRAAAREIVAAQLPDGGWEQLPGRGPDAWATGTALVVLHLAADMPVSDPIYQSGAAFLVRTQGEDGVWWVRSRTWPFQPHFNGKFPHGKDQWISAAGTSWAAMALTYLLKEPARRPALPDVAALIKRDAQPAWSGGTTAGGATAGATLAKADPALFRRQVAPILERSCYGCHGSEKHRGGLSLATRDGLLKGGQSGDPAVVVGKSSESELIDYVSDNVEDLEMPPLTRRSKYPALSPAEIAVLKTWIDAGLPWDADAPPKTGLSLEPKPKN